MSAKFKACIVEDNELVRKSLESLCSIKHFDAVCYDSAELFLEDPDWDVDCYIFDFRLPGISGFELLERIRELGYETPAIIASGNFSRPTLDEVSQISNLTCLNKPFSPSGFLDLLDRISQEKSLN